MLQLKCSLTSTAQAFLPRKLLLKTWEFDLIPCFLCGFCWFEWLFFHWTICFHSFRPFQGPPNSLKEFLISAAPQGDPHANKAAFPRENLQDQVLDVSPGAAQEEELSDSLVMLHQEEPLQITKQSFWQEGKEPFLSNHPNKGSFLPWDPFPYTNCTLRSWGKHLPDSFPPTSSSGCREQFRRAKVWISWWTSCTEQQENLDGTAWLVPGVSDSTLGCSSSPSMATAQGPQKGRGSGRGWDFHQQNRGQGKSMSNYVSH